MNYPSGNIILPSQSQNQNQQKAIAKLLQEWQFPNGIIKPQMLAANTTMAAGDLYFVNSSGIFQRLAIGTAGQKLTVVNGLPVWA